MTDPIVQAVVEFYSQARLKGSVSIVDTNECGGVVFAIHSAHVRCQMANHVSIASLREIVGDRRVAANHRAYFARSSTHPRERDITPSSDARCLLD